MKNKKGFQLAANTLVMMILGIVMFGMGLMFFTNMFQGAEKIKLNIDSRTETQIQNLLLSSGDKVAIPFDSYEILPGESATYGLGVFNILSTEGSKDNFIFTVKCNGNAFVPGDPCPSQELFYIDEPMEVEKNKQKVILIGVKAKKGVEKKTYVYDVYVCKEEAESCDMSVPPELRYGPTQQFYVKIR
jgi:hypothetical protein